MNNAIEEIGLTWYHLKLFFITGFGYAADAMLLLAQQTSKTFVDLQWEISYPAATEVKFVGLVCGALGPCLSGDVIGRKICFNITLFFSATFALFLGHSWLLPNVLHFLVSKRLFQWWK